MRKLFTSALLALALVGGVTIAQIVNEPTAIAEPGGN